MSRLPMLVLLPLVLVCASVGAQTCVLVEAECFADLGGWTVDTQAVEAMGSPYLLAHGMGEPVADATTTVTFPEAGEYRVFVRTRDWVPPHAPGKFLLLVNGTPLAETFGAKGDGAWFWQEGGRVVVEKTQAQLALRDQTGFDGRCDAVLFVKEADFTPPNAGDALRDFRRKALKLPEAPPDAGEYDLVVVGGGLAGCSAALSAARLGLKVALIQDRPVLGGNNSSEVRVAARGGIDLPPYPALSGVVKELRGNTSTNAGPAHLYGDNQRLSIVRAEKGIDLRLNTHVYAVEKAGDRIAAVLGSEVRTAREWRFKAPLFADCTGDGDVGFLAGADFRMGAETNLESGEPLAPPEQTPSRRHMGISNMWYAKKTDAPAPFPELPWALRVTAGPGQTSGDWNWESGYTEDTILQAEQIRDYNLRAVFGTWAYTKNRAPDAAKYANWKLAWVAAIGGKRESRRLLGDIILSFDDIRKGRDFPDAVVTSTWPVDLHYPASLRDDYHASVKTIAVEPFPIPFRCLYSRNVPNLMMAGRDISVTHVVLGSTRVQNTTGMTGAVVGRAAFVCRKNNCTPREVYEKHLDELKQALEMPVRPTRAP